MSRTRLERMILESRRSEGFILLPLLDKLLENEVRVEDQADKDFIQRVLEKRARPREKNVFSPSMLGSCMRQAYFARTGMVKEGAFTPRTNGYFLDGDFRHLKWQFAMWKLHRQGVIELIEPEGDDAAPGTEVRVHHPDGDYAGTIDNIFRHVRLDEIFTVDWKGMMLQAFQKFVSFGTPDDYKIQLVGYSRIVNAQYGLGVKRALLIGECKPGPLPNGMSLGLHEDALDVERSRFAEKRRLLVLRRYVTNEETPPPACVSTTYKEFQECPFSRFCKEEVLAIQRERENARRRDPIGRQVAVPQRTGSDRSKGNRSRRKEHPA